jgi:hypothetical protein
MDPPGKRPLLFHREYLRFSGGHLKFRHYFEHAERSTRFQPRIYISPRSIPEAAALWRGMATPPLESWRPADAAAFFVAGEDWTEVPDPSPVPVVNLIQHVRHADPGSPRWKALSRPAIRICVSREVADAIEATGRVNGPVHVIPVGLDPSELPTPARQRDRAAVIAGPKNPGFARAVHERLAAAGHESECVVDRMPRSDFLARIARAGVAITVPNEREGFFLPALEAMALGAIAVCPDCIGNRSFCRDGETAFRPPYEVDAVVDAARSALSLPPPRAEAMRAAAAAEAHRHSIEAERSAFLRILDSL